MPKEKNKNSNGVKLIYCTSIAFSDKLAHRIQIHAMAKEFQKKLGDNFYLGVNCINVDDKNINIICFNDNKSYSLAWKYLKFIKQDKIDYVYCRENRLLFFIILYNKLIFHLRLRFVYEIHSISLGTINQYIEKLLSKQVNYFIFITKNLRDNYLKKYLIAQFKILIAPDGVDLEKFVINISKNQARKEMFLPQGKKIIVYIGSFYLYDWKGIDILLESTKYFDNIYLFILIGGKEKEIEQIKNKYNLDNIILISQKPHEQIPIYLKAADIFILPNKSGDITSEKFTSPLKMFEYMASGRSIVASDLPSIREVLNENNSILVEPNNPQKLAEGIKKALTDQELTQKITEQAFKDVQNYTWEKRVEGILEFIVK